LLLPLIKPHSLMEVLQVGSLEILIVESLCANMGETTPARELVYNEGGERTQHVSPRTDTA
jgi:hypothetical protein